MKDALSHDLVQTMREVFAGHWTKPQNLAERLAHRRAHPALTAREIAVTKLIAKGHRNKEIAAELRITEDTAKVHVKSPHNASTDDR